MEKKKSPGPESRSGSLMTIKKQRRYWITDNQGGHRLNYDVGYLGSLKIVKTDETVILYRLFNVKCTIVKFVISGVLPKL